VFQGSGTSGNPITLLFATGATMSKAAWSNTGAIYAGNKSYIIVDGGGAAGMAGFVNGVEGNPALANGIIENTDNGPLFGNQVDSKGVSLESCPYAIVRNLVVRNLWQRVQGSSDPNRYGLGIGLGMASAPHTQTDSLVENCIVHDSFQGLLAYYQENSTGITFSRNTVYNVNWNTATDNDSAALLDGFVVSECHFHSLQKFDDPLGDFHHEYFFVIGQNGGLAQNVTFHSNKFGPGYGDAATAALFIQNRVKNVIAYNNIFLTDTDNGTPTTGGVYWNPSKDLTGTFELYNNTFDVIRESGDTTTSCPNINFTPYSTGSGTQTVLIKNNVFRYGTAAIAIYSNGSVSLTSDRNILNVVSDATAMSYSSNTDTVFKTFAQWQAFGFDASSSAADPMLRSDYLLETGSPAVGTGQDLSSVFTVDFAGVTRTVPWDRGALKYIGSNLGIQNLIVSGLILP
jgi:hypothetical protein